MDEPPALGSGERLTALHCKLQTVCYEMLHRPRTWKAHANTVMNLRLTQKEGNLTC
jgi:hypothetical protein